MSMLKTITIVKTDKINLDDITKDINNYILSDEYADEDLKTLVDDTIEQYADYNPYDDEIEEFDEIVDYVEKNLSVEALEILDEKS